MTERFMKNHKLSRTENPPEKKDIGTLGTVLEALPNAMFRVVLADDKPILAYLSGKMHLHRIRVLVGDKVLMTLDAYGERGRIIKRL